MGLIDGRTEGVIVVGTSDGIIDGTNVGTQEGSVVGFLLGLNVIVGTKVGGAAIVT